MKDQGLKFSAPGAILMGAVQEQTYRGVEVSCKLVSAHDDPPCEASWEMSYMCPVTGLKTISIFKTPTTGGDELGEAEREVQAACEKVTAAIDALADVACVEDFGVKVSLEFNSEKAKEQLSNHFKSLGFGTGGDMVKFISPYYADKLAEICVSAVEKGVRTLNEKHKTKEHRESANIKIYGKETVEYPGTSTVCFQAVATAFLASDAVKKECDFSLFELHLEMWRSLRTPSGLKFFALAMSDYHFRKVVESAAAHIIQNNIEIKDRIKQRKENRDA